MKKIHTYIYEKKHRSGNVTYVVRYKDAYGKWVAFSAGTFQQEALVYEGKIRQDLFSGIDPKEVQKQKADDALIPEVVEYFFNHPRFNGLSIGSQENSRSFVRRFISSRWSKVRISSLTEKHFFGWYDTLRAEGMANSTIRRNHHILSSIFKVYCKAHKTVKNPMSELPAPKEIAL